MKRKDEMRIWPWTVVVALALTPLIPQMVSAAQGGDASVSSSSRTATPWLVAQRGGGEGPPEGFMEVLPPSPEGQRGRGAPTPPPEAPRPPSGAMMPATPVIPLPAEPRFPGEEVGVKPEAARAPEGFVELPRGAIPKAGPEMLPVPPSAPQGSPERPGYFSGKLLKGQDFEKEQKYLGQKNPIGALYESLKPVPAASAALPPAAALPPPGSDKMLEGLRRDMVQNRPLVEAFSRHGAPPTPQGAGRMVELAGRFPDEFRGLAARTARASKNPSALGEVEEALQAFFSKGAVAPEEWNELGYVVARLIQEDETSGAGSGQPLFQKPLLVNQEVEHPKDKTDGKEMEEWFKGLGEGDVSGLFPDVEDLDKTLEGGGKGVSWGDGVQGMPDQEGKPDAGLPDPGGVPQIPIKDPFGKGRVPDSGVGGTKEPYGGLNINIARQGQTAEDKPKGSKPGGEGQTHSGPTTEKAVLFDVTGAENAGEKVTYFHYKDENGIVNEHVIVVQGEKGFTAYNYKDGKWTFWTYQESGSGGTVGPAGEGSDTPPVHEPQLLMRAEKEGVGQKKESSHAAPITDPMPVRGALSVEAGPSDGELPTATGPSGAEGTEQKWNFAGKKPGSEVTDYGVFGGPPGKPELNVKRDLSEVTDPAEPESAPAGKETLASPALMRQQAASALAPVFAQLLVSSVQQAGEAQQGGQAPQADAATAGQAPSGPAPEGPPPTGGGGGPSN